MYISCIGNQPGAGSSGGDQCNSPLGCPVSVKAPAASVTAREANPPSTDTTVAPDTGLPFASRTLPSIFAVQAAITASSRVSLPALASVLAECQQ